MKNKFRIGEIVLINGTGKVYEKHFKALAIIQEKDYYFNEYLVTILSENIEDWFDEKDIEIVMDRIYKKTFKYKVVLAIEKNGLDLILNEIKPIKNKNNNILKKVDFYKEYKKNKKRYAIIVWTSTYWSDTNFVVEKIEEVLNTLRKQNIAYNQIILGETDPTFIKINQFIDNDKNVDIFEISRKIKIKNIGGILV